MASGICDTGKTRLSYADIRPTCRISASRQGVGNVESTAIGFVRNGAKVVGTVPTLIKRDKCSPIQFKPVDGPC